MANNINKKFIELLEKLQEKHPDDKDLQDFMQCIVEPDEDQNKTSKSPFVRRVMVSPETMDAAQMLINAGVTDPNIIHEQTGIPMEALAVMGLEVPVHDYVIPIMRVSAGFVSVKGVSPEDALTMFEHNVAHAIVPKDAPSDASGIKVARDLNIIEFLTDLAEEGIIGHITDSGLVSPLAKADKAPEGPLN